MSPYKSTSKDRKRHINTSSLPDIIFMLLFFFMVSTIIREKMVKVKQQLPEATEAQKLERKSLVSYIYIGAPVNSKLHGSSSRIQLNDAFASKEQIGEFVAREIQLRDEPDRKFMTTSLKVDNDTKMGTVSDVKQELRKAQALKINYSSRKKMKRRSFD